MKPPSANHLLATTTALCAIVLLGACKTTETSWRKEEIGTDWEKRTLGKVTQAQNQMKAAHDGEDTDGYMQNEFDMNGDIDTKKSLFSNKKARTKDYGTKDFAGSADEYKSGDYQFLKRQNFEAKTSRDQNELFATGESPDNKRRFFGRNKRARTKDYADDTKSFGTGTYSGADSSGGRKIPAIVQDRARDDGATMNVDDVRTILHGTQ
ncbi:MAG: hypothetical protein ACI9UA_002179 [Pseudoalteromonas tetraodonis]|jgi:hypothetical protein